jgi:hypothetical protein
MKNGLKDGDVFDIAIVMMARVQWTCYLGVHIVYIWGKQLLWICDYLHYHDLLWWQKVFGFAYV